MQEGSQKGLLDTLGTLRSSRDTQSAQFGNHQGSSTSQEETAGKADGTVVGDVGVPVVTSVDSSYHSALAEYATRSQLENGTDASSGLTRTNTVKSDKTDC